MTIELAVGIAMAVFILSLLCGMHIHSVLLLSGAVGLICIAGTGLLAGLIGAQPIGAVSSYSLSTIPLYVLMAQFIVQAGIVKDLFQVVHKLSRGRTGVLGALTFGAGGVFGAVSGSGVATAAALGQVAVPELRSRGFSPHLAGATAAAAGSLSSIVPPSLALIVYGVATETPIGDLFIAAVIPALLMLTIYTMVMIGLLRRESRAAGIPRTKMRLSEGGETISRYRLSVAIGVVTIVGIVIFGGIYLGFVTPTEAGALGAFTGLVGAFLIGRVDRNYVVRSISETVKLTSMVMLILVAAQIFGRFISVSRVPRDLIAGLAPLVERPALMLAILAVAFFVAFMFLEGAAVILMSIPVVIPLVETMGVDVLWFGIFICVISTIGQLTPPVGLCVYAVSSTARISANKIFRPALAMAIIATIVMAAALVLFPDMTNWLLDADDGGLMTEGSPFK
ncbi:TRAP transporter large permease [Arthrobacter sulfonylureivorans]|uniref:TRAP transporter large permease n=1 Tax=Arthrobacter sulfonylureivorans TaxID=2486855 RepID=A0ABY3WHP1_9MICC|nr:TRAP transporter large permease [Arthrobacter sulfonylureivorans]UNK47881.1 TRAP transporter large permease [Arthrobacter sulfonylureivorans]